MPAFFTLWVTGVIYFLYWANRRRRMILKKRSPVGAGRCLHALARNLSFMLSPSRIKTVKIRGSLCPAGGGAVLYSLHYGAWEMMPQVLRAAGFRIGIIANRYGSDQRRSVSAWANRLLHRWRSRNGVIVFYRNDSRRIMEFIKNGGVFAMLVDGSERYAKFPRAQKLAALCRVPLIPFAMYRDRGQGILDIGCDLDSLIARRPDDYLWFYRSRPIAA